VIAGGFLEIILQLPPELPQPDLGQRRNPIPEVAQFPL
jgi:hypothetical protein